MSKHRSPSIRSKSIAKTKGDRRIDSVFFALAHPSRRNILLVIWYRGGKMTSGEIANRFSCAWPTTTRHLRVLESAKLVQVKKKGRDRIYYVNKKAIERVTLEFLKSFNRAWVK